MKLTEKQFYTLYPYAKKHGDVYNNLANAMQLYDIKGIRREYYFLAQLAHESARFKYIRELGNRAYFKRYDGRKDLGNTYLGDGYKYRGRGFIQLTGRFNYGKYGQKLGIDLVNRPELAETPKVASLIAALYWSDHGLNELADKLMFTKITKKINGGLNGLADRKNELNRLYTL